jgi:hypothetical protein
MNLRRKVSLLLLLACAALARGQTYGPFPITSTASTQCARAAINNTKSSSVRIVVGQTAFSATLTVSLAVGGNAANVTNVVPLGSTASNSQSTITANGDYGVIGTAGHDLVLVCATAYTSGTATVTLDVSDGVSAELIGGSGSGGTNNPGGSANQIQLNGGSVFAGYASSGIVKTTTGVPSAATSTDVISLFSTCSGTQYLGADGACHTPTTGTITSVTAGTGLTGGGSSGGVTLNLSTPVSVANGGSGASTLTGILKGNGTSAFTIAASADVIALFSGTCNTTTFLRGDGSCSAAGTGTITSVTAGTGLTGGGSSGSVTLNLASPVSAANGGTGVSNTGTLTLGTSNQNWATLGTGIVKNTTTTGAITDATAADVYGLFTSCTGSSGLFLKDGGTCAAPAGSGNTTSTALATGFLPKASGANAIINSAADDGITTANTFSYSGSGGITATAGPLTSGLPAGGVGSSLFLKQEGTIPAGLSTAGQDDCYSDSTQHGVLCNFNAGTTLPLVQGPASNTSGHLATWSGTNGGKLVDGGAVPAGISGLVAGQRISASNTTTVIPSGPVFDTTQVTGADLAARINNCLGTAAGLNHNPGICDAQAETSLSATAATITIADPGQIVLMPPIHVTLGNTFLLSVTASNSGFLCLQYWQCEIDAHANGSAGTFSLTGTQKDIVDGFHILGGRLNSQTGTEVVLAGFKHQFTNNFVEQAGNNGIVPRNCNSCTIWNNWVTQSANAAILVTANTAGLTANNNDIGFNTLYDNNTANTTQGAIGAVCPPSGGSGCSAVLHAADGNNFHDNIVKNQVLGTGDCNNPNLGPNPIASVSGNGTTVTLVYTTPLTGTFIYKVGQTVALSTFSGAWAGINGNQVLTASSTTSISFTNATTGTTTTGSVTYVPTSTDTGCSESFQLTDTTWNNVVAHNHVYLSSKEGYAWSGNGNVIVGNTCDACDQYTATPGGAFSFTHTGSANLGGGNFGDTTVTGNVVTNTSPLNLLYGFTVVGASGASTTAWTAKNVTFTGNTVDATRSCMITAYSITSNVITATCSNTFAATDVVLLQGFSTSTFLNGSSVTLTSASSTQFVGALTHANASATENGQGIQTGFAATGGIASGFRVANTSGATITLNNCRVNNNVATGGVTTPWNTNSYTGFTGVCRIAGNGLNNSADSAPVANDVVTYDSNLQPEADSGILSTNLTTQTSNGAAGQVCTYTGANKVCVPSATPTLGASGTVGTVALGNTTSGTVTLGTVAGALGSVTASLPANTGTIAETNLAQTFSALQTFGSNASIAGTAHGVLLSENTSAAVATAVGSTNQVLNGNSGADPTWGAVPLAALPNIPINDVISATGAIATIADGNNPLVINCALTSGTTCLTTGETTAASTAGAVEHQITTLTTTTAIPLQITQGAAGPANAAAPNVLNISAAAAGGAAGASNAGSAGAAIGLLTGAGSAGGATTGNGGAGGAFTVTEGAGGAAGGTSTNNGGNGGGVAWTTGAGGNGGSGVATAGSGGPVTFTLGAPGTNSATGTAGAVGLFNVTGNAPASTANATGVNAGTVFQVSGVTGGASSNAAGTAGVGSSPSVSAGIGGAGTGTNAVGGQGGTVVLNGGNGGASLGTGINSFGGNITLNPGAAGTGGSGTAGKAGVVQVTGPGAGFVGFQQGTAVTTANTQIPANTIIEEAPTAVTAYTINKPGAAPVNNNSAQLYSNASPGVGAWAKMAQTEFLTSTYTNATTSFTNVTGLSFAVEANTNYTMECNLDYQTSASTADIKIQFTGPASPTAVTYDMVSEVTASTLSASVATAFSTSLTEAGTPTITTNFPLKLSLTLINGANAGTVQLQAAATGTGTISIIPGSCQSQ